MTSIPKCFPGYVIFLFCFSGKQPFKQSLIARDLLMQINFFDWIHHLAIGSHSFPLSCSLRSGHFLKEVFGGLHERWKLVLVLSGGRGWRPKFQAFNKNQSQVHHFKTSRNKETTDDIENRILVPEGTVGLWRIKMICISLFAKS